MEDVSAKVVKKSGMRWCNVEKKEKVSVYVYFFVPLQRILMKHFITHI